MILTNHQQKQREVVDKIVDQISSKTLNFSTVSTVNDYEVDPRICLTGVHLPQRRLIEQVQAIIEPLQKIEPTFYYYPSDSLHLTIKNIRVINFPPHFSKDDIEKAKGVFIDVIGRHSKFQAYFYRLLLFPNNLALIGTTDPELDNIITDLDETLNKAGLPDDKIYINSKYFFINMTLARFNTEPSPLFKKKVAELSKELKIDPYLIDSVSLMTANAVFENKKEIGTWRLQTTGNL